MEEKTMVSTNLWEDLTAALYQAVGRIEALDPDPGIVTRQVHELCLRVLAEAERHNLEAPCQ